MEKVNEEKSAKSEESTPQTSLKMQLPKLTISNFRIRNTPLTWVESDKIPVEMTATNTGYLVNVEVEYSGIWPSLNGCMLQCPYRFWCFQFHWDSKDDDDTEPGSMQKELPMEIHVVFYNTSYANTNEALEADDGILVLVFVCKLSHYENPELNNFTSNISKIQKAGTSTKIPPSALSRLFESNITNYLFYSSPSCKENKINSVLWIISSKYVSINIAQLSQMRSLRGFDDKCIMRNCPSTKSIHGFGLPNVVHSVTAMKGLLKNLTAEKKLDIVPQPPTKESVIKSIDSLMIDLNHGIRVENSYNVRHLEVQANNNNIESQTNNSNSKSKLATLLENTAGEKEHDIDKIKLYNDQQLPTKDSVLSDRIYLENSFKSNITENQDSSKKESQALTVWEETASKKENDFEEKNVDDVQQSPMKNSVLSSGNKFNDVNIETQVFYNNIVTQSSAIWKNIENKHEIDKKHLDDMQQPPTKESVLRSIDNILSDLNGESNVFNLLDDINPEIPVDDKKLDSHAGRKSLQKTHREGVRMNSTALKREIHNKEKLQKQQNQP